LSKPERIGILGGTFDPIHNTHIELARAALEQAGLDRVLFVVSATPPHKRHEVVASADDRYALVNSALAKEERMQACDIELHRNGPSYTADTLRELTQRHPGAEFFLILGLDALRDLPGWREPEAILERAHILAAWRPDADGRAPEQLQGHYTQLDFPPCDISSTDVRQRLMRGEAVQDTVPQAVLESIRERGLYGVAGVES